MKNIFRALRFLPKFKPQLILAVIVSIISAALVTVLPLAIQRVIDDIFKAVSNKDLTFSVLYIPLAVWAGLRITLIGFDWLREIVEDNFFRKAAIEFRRSVSEKVHSLSITYFEKHRVGQIVSEIGQSPFKLAEWLSNVIDSYAVVTLNALFALVVLTYKFPPVALVTLTLAAGYVWYSFKTMQQNRKYWKVHRRVINDYVGIQTENVSFVAHIRALGIEKIRSKLFGDRMSEHDQSMRHMFNFQHRRNFVAGLIELCLSAIPLSMFAYLAIKGTLRPSDIYVAAVYLGTISSCASRLSRMWNNTTELNDTLGETLAILDNQNIVQDPVTPKKLGGSGDIDLREVSFQYEGTSSEALSGITLHIDKGQTVALVGRSGSGKTTITKLLLRFYDPSEGVISISEVDIKEVKQEDLRKQFGVVMQDVALFNDTVANNISIARPGATRKEVEAAAKLAHAHEFISELSDGYDTLVGERGVKLSGGEKQRVSIARAVLRNPEVVLLDEATSALDSESEKYVQEGLKKLLKGRTAIIIAHRLSTIAHADKIVVLDKGKIVEEGTFEELKKAGGTFADLLAHQQL